MTSIRSVAAFALGIVLVTAQGSQAHTLTPLRSYTSRLLKALVKAPEKAPADRKVLFVGEVKDVKSGKPIRGAQITVSLPGYIPPVQYTDSQGIFAFPRADADVEYVRVQITAKGYKNYDRRIDIRVLRENEEFLLEPEEADGPVTFDVKVNDLTKTDIKLTKGQHVSVVATGLISVGPIVGSVGPDGKSTNLGFSLSRFNIVQQFPHGALMYRIGKSDSWKFCGSAKEFTAPAAGLLEFEVNDADKTGNGKEDYFAVVVTVNPK